MAYIDVRFNFVEAGEDGVSPEPGRVLYLGSDMIRVDREQLVEMLFQDDRWFEVTLGEGLMSALES